MNAARRRNVRWVIIERALQMNKNPLPDRELTLHMVQREIVLYRSLRSYDIYRRR